MKKDVTEYSSGSKFLHWLIALIVIVMLTATFFFDDLPKSMRSFAFMMHKSFGITVLFLMFLRLYWIHRSGKPALPATGPAQRLILFSTSVAKGTASSLMSLIYMGIMARGIEYANDYYALQGNMSFTLFCAACGLIYMLLAAVAFGIKKADKAA